eukprot:2414908-Heterocapsa_arctica.AAC.1
MRSVARASYVELSFGFLRGGAAVARPSYASASRAAAQRWHPAQPQRSSCPCPPQRSSCPCSSWMR